MQARTGVGSWFKYAGGGEDSKLEALAKLGELKAKGVLSGPEFETQKARIPSGI